MTREIALHCMKSELDCELCEKCPIYEQTGADHCYSDALRYVIDILEQEPCEDAVSREEKETKVRMLEDIDKEEILKAVILLDLFTKTFCRYKNDYERFDDLKFRCDECPFCKDNTDCLVKMFKNKYASNYRDFGSMEDI